MGCCGGFISFFIRSNVSEKLCGMWLVRFD